MSGTKLRNGRHCIIIIIIIIIITFIIHRQTNKQKHRKLNSYINPNCSPLQMLGKYTT